MTAPGEHTPLLTGAGSNCNSSADSELAKLPVYHTIFLVLREVVHNVDIPLSDEQMRSPEIQFAIIQPLEELLGNMHDPSIVYVLLLVRLHFLRERDSALASSSLNDSRAQLCELLAIKLLRHQATDEKGPSAGLLAMSRALVGGFHAFQGADSEVLERVRQKEGYASRIMVEGAGKTNALELAILGRARNFIKSQATQRVITAIWEGRVVYSASTFLDILPDRWKKHEIRLYNLKNAPILDHYRLRVPKYRAYIDFWAFIILFVSFLSVILDRQNRPESTRVSELSLHEIWFFIYALGYSLDKVASVMEHGWTVFSAGLTNGLDALCLPIFALAFAFRVHSVATNEAWASDEAFSILSCAACLMFPRLAFAAISNNVLILSLRAMLADFFWLMGIAVFCFLGFVFALNHMSYGDFSVGRIAEWLIFIWFGLDGSGIDKSPSFHPILGPALFIAYAALSNTLLVSLLVAILSGTYANIAADAAAEDMFRKAVMTFEGVKSDSLFDYVPPLNLVALCVMWPISLVSSPRWFHKINVATTRVLSLPILLLIALYERQAVASSPMRQWFVDTRLRLTKALPTKWAHKVSLLEGAHWECEAVFEYSPSGDEKDDEEDEDQLSLSEDDEVQDSLETTLRNRVNSRASKILAPAPPTRSPSLARASSAGAVPGRSNSPPPMPIRGQTSTDLSSTASSSSQPVATQKQTHFASHERVPTNSSMYGTSSARHRSPERSSQSALSTSPSGRYTSPLAGLYRPHDNDPFTGLGHRRKMSLGARPLAADMATAPSQTELKNMISALSDAMARLEAKLDDRGQ